MELNKEQQIAVDSTSGVFVVVAIPGAGKTACLTTRVIRLINDGVKPENILCLTFTNKAADEMRDRIASQTSGADQVWISTFHKLCVAILRKFGDRIALNPNFTIITGDDQFQLMKKIARMNEVELSNDELYRLINGVNTYREDLIAYTDFIDEISEEIDGAEKVLTEYLNTLNIYHVVDFSGLLYLTHKILTEFPPIAQHLACKFRYISVDEWQDTNKIQYEIIKIIAKYHGNLFVIGDGNQALYAFRGARPENMLDILTDFPGAKKITLTKNYRSTSNILKVAERLIKYNPDNEDTVLESVKGDGEEVQVLNFNSPDREANFVCGKIQQLVEEEGYKYSDFSVLYRSNAISKTIEQKCREYDIPYKIIGGFSFYDRKEIKDIIAYLTLLVNPHDSIAFHRAISYPKRSLGDVAIGKIERACQEYKKNVFEVCKGHIDELGLATKTKNALQKFCELYENAPKDLVGSVNHILNGSGYIKELNRIQDEKNVDKIQNLQEFIGDIEQFSKNNSESSLQQFLQHISLQNIEKEEEKDAVKLMSVHISKGSENRVIYVVSVEERQLPHFLSINEGESGICSERKIAFVALTRAKERLFVSWNRYRPRYGFNGGKPQMMPCQPSRFIQEMFTDTDEYYDD